MEEPRSDRPAADTEGHRGLTRNLKWAFWGLAIGLLVMILYFFNVTPADIAHTVTRCLSCH